jgi:hypothetical protein
MAILNSKQLTAKIKSIKGNSTKLRDSIQEALISCAFYAIKDGDAGSFNRLLDAVGTNTRIKGLTLWAETWGCVRVKDEKFIINKSARAEMSVNDENDFAEFESMMRAAVAWYDMVPAEKATSMFDADAYLANVITKLTKEHKDDLAFVIENAIREYRKTQVLELLKLENMIETDE